MLLRGYYWSKKQDADRSDRDFNSLSDKLNKFCKQQSTHKENNINSVKKLSDKYRFFKHD